MTTSRAPLRPLPIDDLLPAILRSLDSNSCAIVEASPGSGKTTRLPPALLAANFLEPESEILVLEPRRLAAKLAAMRVADERGEKVGASVGYHFRFERVASPETRLLFLTEGMLMRRLLRDPKLKKVKAVLLDEFHERSLHSDMALTYLKALQKKERPDLKIIVMSATLESERLSQFLENAPVFPLELRPYPIEIQYWEGNFDRPLEHLVRDGVAKALGHDLQGDLLVFLPGVAEIRRAAEALENLRRQNNLLVTPLYADLSREEQQLALFPAKQRKVILATNVAETSLTIEGVTGVIDSGLHRSATYSWWSGVPSLKTKTISRASAIQRAGRAGRTGPGFCLRLYSRGDFEGRPPFETPEIQRSDLAPSALELKALGVKHVKDFPWFEPPKANALEAALSLLYRLGALTSEADGSDLTEIGRKMAEFPTHPRLARLMLEAEKRKVGAIGARLAALISESRLERLDALTQVNSPPTDEGFRRAERQFKTALPGGEKPHSGWSRDDLAASVLAGFPDRLGKKRTAARGKANETELVLSSGGSARLEDSGVIAEHDFFVVLDLQEQQHLGQLRSQLKVRAVCPIEADWLLELTPSPVRDEVKVSWDRERRRVVTSSALKYDEITLLESASKPTPSPDTFRVLAKEAVGLDVKIIPSLSPGDFVSAVSRVIDKEAMESFLGRLLLLSKYFPDKLPEWESLKKVFFELWENCLSAEALESLDWKNEWLGHLSSEAAFLMSRVTPETLILPSGRNAKVHYPLDKPPWVESRLQDFFGWKKGPTILDGKVALTVHLLAPNQRALQVTGDLAGFWEREYPRIRKELGRRYPRHDWPEDPSIAIPQKPRRPRS